MEEDKKGKFTIIVLIVIIFLIIGLLGVLLLNVISELKNDEEDTDLAQSSDFSFQKVIEFAKNNNISGESSALIQKTPEGAAAPTEKKVQEVANNNYHYSQIDDTAKTIYDKLNDNIEEMKSGTYDVKFGKQFNSLLHEAKGKENLNKSYQEAIDALMLDYPEYFFINVEKLIMTVSSTTVNNTTTYEVTIGHNDESYLSDGFSNKNDVDVAIRAVRNFRYQASVGGDDYKIVLNAHDWLINSMEYDQTLSEDNIRNIYGALANKKAVCEGYAKAFKYIMDGANIPCIVAVGNGINASGKTESHAWNYVKVNGVWYAIDVTWDDPILIGGGKLPDKDRYRYFLKGKSFLDNHFPTGLASETGIAFTYPELGNDYK